MLSSLKRIARSLGKIFRPKLFFGAVLGVYVFTITLGFFVLAPKAKADSGDTEYGKWYTTDQIKLQSTVGVAGPDGVWKDTPFVRVGADSGNFKVRIKISLVAPATLTFAPDQLAGQPQRDGVKAPDKYFNNSFGQRIYPLVGLGTAYGVGSADDKSDRIICQWKDINWFWQSKSSIQVCADPKLGSEAQTSNDKMAGTQKAGTEIYNNGPGYFVIDSAQLKKLSFSADPSKVYVLKVWPNLRVNTGDLSLTEAVTATAISIAASQGAKKLAQVLPGAASAAAGMLQKGWDKVKSVGELAKSLVAKGVAEDEAKTIAQVIVDGVADLGKTAGGVLNKQLLEDTAGKILSDLTAKGFEISKSMAVADEVMATAIKSAGEVTSGLAKISTEFTEPAVVAAATRIAESQAVKHGATEVAAKAAGSVLSKAFSKVVPFVGWAWTAVDVGLYFDTFRKDSLPLYPSNAHKVFVQVYATDKEARDHKDDPMPDEIASLVAAETGAKTGSPTAPGGGISGISKLLNDIFTGISQLFINLIYSLFYKLVAPLLQGFLSIRVYTDAFVNVIYPGWEVLRNVCNIYFILAIIAIAMGTLFRVESYQFKHLLVQLIIAALIVNFSLVLAQAVLGVADTVQNQFLPNNEQVIKQLGLDLMPNKIKDIVNANELVSNSVFGTAATNLFLMTMALGSFLVFCGILIFLLIRIVMLWILLMISPLAYAARVLPSTKQYSGQWWGQFLKYAFFTPIMAFMMNMAAIIAVNYEFVFRDITKQADFGKFTTLVFAVASNVLLLVFLIAALKIAEQFGIFFADKVTEIAKKGMFMPFKMAAGGVAVPAKFLGKRAGGFIGSKYNEWTSKLVTQEHGAKGFLKKAAFAVVNPVNFFRGWGEYAKERKEWRGEIAKGAGQVVAGEALSLGKEKFDYKQMAMSRIKRQLKAKIAEAAGDDPGRAPSMDLYRRVLDMTGLIGQLYKGAVGLYTNDQGWGDDTHETIFSPDKEEKMRARAIKAGATKDKGLKLFEYASKQYDDFSWQVAKFVEQDMSLDMLYKLKYDNEDNWRYRQDAHGRFLDPEMQAFVEDEHNQLGLQNIAELTDGAKKVGHPEQMFGSKRDDRSGYYIPLVDSTWADKKFEETGDYNFGKRSLETMAELGKEDTDFFLRTQSPHSFRPKVKDRKRETFTDPRTGKTRTWVEDEWGYGYVQPGGTNTTMFMKAVGRKLVGPKYTPRAVRAQGRLSGRIAGDFFDSQGNIKPGHEGHWASVVAENPQFNTAMKYVHLYGNNFKGGNPRNGAAEANAADEAYEAGQAAEAAGFHEEARVALQAAMGEARSAAQAAIKEVTEAAEAAQHAGKEDAAQAAQLAADAARTVVGGADFTAIRRVTAQARVAAEKAQKAAGLKGHPQEET